jgi:hypothetical protein
MSKSETKGEPITGLYRQNDLNNINTHKKRE